MILRPYQVEANDAVRECVRTGKNPILVAPTGSGKTVILRNVCRQMAPQNPCMPLWVAHRKELLDQAGWHLSAVGFTPGHDILVSSIQSIHKVDFTRVSAIIVDECHHAVPSSKRYSSLFNHGVPVIGATATPYRLDGKSLGDLFDEIVVAATTSQLIDDGYLCKPTIYSHPAPDMSQVRVTGGDYNKGGMGKAVCSRELVADIVQTWKCKSSDMKTICFAASIAHSKMIVDEFNDAGIPARHVDGTTELHERQDAIQELDSCKISVLSNCELFTEGWDMPTLECSVIARPTASLALHVQICGRVLRMAEGKSGATILDHAGNMLDHGPPWRDIEFTLQTGVLASSERSFGTRICPGCYLMVPSRPLRCISCGHMVTPEPRQAIPETRAGELEEFKKSKKEFYREMLGIVKDKGYNLGYAAHRYRSRFGVWPRGDWMVPMRREVLTAYENP